MSQAYLHYNNMEDVRERLENSIATSNVVTLYDGEDCFITVTQRNNTTGDRDRWDFCVDFGTGKVQMLEPTEDEEGFTSDNEVFRIIKNFLNGGSSREKRFENKIGSSRKPIKSVYDVDTFAQVENAVDDLQNKLSSAGIKIEDIYDDYFEDVRCKVLSTENLNPIIIANMNDVLQEYMKSHPNIAIETEVNDYFYGRNIYVLLADEYYIDSSKKSIKSSHDRETLKKVIRAYLDKMGYKDVEGGVDAAADYIWQNEDYYADYDLHSKVKQWFKETKENYPETLIKASRTIKSGISPEQNKFNSAYNSWFGHFQMNLDRVPQYLEGIKWCDENKGTSEYEQLCKEYNCYPVGDREKASFYNALKQVGAITSSKKPIKSGYYDTREHPEGGGTCDNCHEEVMPGDGYESDFESSREMALEALIDAFKLGNINLYNHEEKQRFIDFLDMEDEDELEDAVSTICNMAFDGKGYQCPDCAKKNIELAAKAWVEDNYETNDEIESSAIKSAKSEFGYSAHEIMSFDEFKNLVKSVAEPVEMFDYKSAYFVILNNEEDCKKLDNKLDDTYGVSCTYYPLQDPYNEHHGKWQFMA